MVNISGLSLTLVPANRTVIYRRRARNGGVLDERVRGTAIAYRTFVADDGIHTDVLVEDGAGVQDFVALAIVTWMKKGPEIPSVDSVAPRHDGLKDASGFVPPRSGL